MSGPHVGSHPLLVLKFSTSYKLNCILIFRSVWNSLKWFPEKSWYILEKMSKICWMTSWNFAWMSFSIMFSKLSRSSLWIFLKLILLVRNMWKVYTRPTSGSDFLGIKSPKTWKFAIIKKMQVKPILSKFHKWKVKTIHFSLKAIRPRKLKFWVFWCPAY
jgi:hypothetical protein